MWTVAVFSWHHHLLRWLKEVFQVAIQLLHGSAETCIHAGPMNACVSEMCFEQELCSEP